MVAFYSLMRNSSNSTAVKACAVKPARSRVTVDDKRYLFKKENVPTEKGARMRKG